MKCSECGRPALAFPSHGSKRSRKSRARVPHAIKNHDLCKGCYRRLEDSVHAQFLRDAEIKERHDDLVHV